MRSIIFFVFCRHFMQLQGKERLRENVLFDRIMTQIQDLHVDKSFYVTQILAKNVSLLPISIWHYIVSEKNVSLKSRLLKNMEKHIYILNVLLIHHVLVCFILIFQNQGLCCIQFQNVLLAINTLKLWQYNLFHLSNFVDKSSEIQFFSDMVYQETSIVLAQESRVQSKESVIV